MNDPMKDLTRDLTRTVLAAGCLLLLIGGAMWVVWPFVGPTIWATMVVVASWPLMLRVQRLLWRRRALAVTVMTAVLLLLFVLPLILAIGTIVGNADRIVGWVQLAAAYEMPDAAPPWLQQLPLVGGSLGGLWEQAAATGLKGLAGKLSPYAGSVTRWFVAEVGNLGFLVVQFLLTAVVAALLYARGEGAAELVHRFARRLAGSRGHDAVVLAGQAIRAVALGVGITAVVQSLLAGLGLWLAGVPFAGLLTAVAFMLCIAQLGALPVLVPAIAWLFWSSQSGWGIFLVVIAVVVVALDNILRPVLIRMGADLPMLLIFAGVIGGLLAFGLVGIFVGPVVLAVGYTLLEAWMNDASGGEPSDARTD